MKLITCSNALYLPRMAPYLESLNQHMDAETICLTVDCEAPGPFRARFPNVRFAAMPATAIEGAPAETQSLQHGSFLEHLPGDDDELIVFTDGDIVMQRAMTPGENEWLARATENGKVSAGWNSGPGETLAMEAQRLFPRADVRELWGPLVDAACWNIGVFALRRETYRRIYERHMELWPKACETFGGPARQQWLVCYVMAELGMQVMPMPYSMHTHGCYTLPALSHFDGPTLLYGSQVVLFKHHL